MTDTAQHEVIRGFVEAMPVTRMLGIEIVELQHGHAVMRLPKRNDLTFDGTSVQGGLVALLADYAALAACGTTLPLGWLMATTGIETHNLLRADGEELFAVGEVIKPGKRHAVARADVYNDALDGSRCLTGLFTAAGVPAPT